MSADRYHPDPAQRALVEEFDRPLDALMPLARLHDDIAETPMLWSALADLGLFGIALPEDVGGVGLGAVEEALLAERLGRRLAAPAVLATMAAAHMGMDVEVDGGGALCAAIAAGAVRVAPAWYGASGVTVADATGADFVLLRSGDGAALHPIANLGVLTPRDDRLWLTMMAGAPQPGAAIASFDRAALSRIRLIDAAALAGVAGAACDMAVAYAAMREQFGRPIGSFQAIKHYCADMAIAARAAIDQTSFAAVAIDDGRGDAPLQVDSALLLGIQAALANARTNIQVHGGIGFSDEADPHLLLKRAHLLATIAGGAEAAAARVAAASRAL